MTVSDVTHTDDGRYVVVDGRRWRATDPSIPDQLRVELVAELMDARREIGRLQRTSEEVDDPEAALAAARQRVDDAKVALGERGAPWWEPVDPAALDRRIDAATRALLRHRSGSVCPSDVARIVAPGDEWRRWMDQVRARGVELAAAGEIDVTQRGEPVDGRTARGPVRWQRGPAFDTDPR